MKAIELLLEASHHIDAGLSEAKLKTLCADLAEQIVDSMDDPIGALIQLKKADDYSSALRSALAQRLATTIQSYGPEGYRHGNFWLSATAGCSYSYKNTPYLLHLEEQRKQAEKIAQALANNPRFGQENSAVFVDADEVIHVIYPATKTYHAESVKIEFVKPEKQTA